MPGGEQTLPPAVTTAIIGGESLSPRAKESWFAHYPKGRKLFNSYGPTETTRGGDGRRNQTMAPRRYAPLDGIYTAIVGEDLRLLPLGCSGELPIAGADRQPGIFASANAEREKFVTLEVNGHPMPAFRTGDIACQRRMGSWCSLAAKFVKRKSPGSASIWVR
ncbi:AMP-binding protein [Serratia ureilytica]